MMKPTMNNPRESATLARHPHLQSCLGRKGPVLSVLGIFVGLTAGPLCCRLAAEGEGSEPSFCLPTPRPDGVPLAQGFEHVPIVKDRSVYLAQGVRFVWGADSPDQPAGVVASWLFPVNRSPQEAIGVYNMDWYEKNHPNWIVYRNDRTSPAYSYIYPVIGGLPPLNMADPAVRDFYFKEFILPCVKQGYRMLAIDNVVFSNWEGRAGHYDASGKWIQLFTGRKDNDPAYADSQIGRLLDLRRRLHPLGVGIAANIGFATAPLEVIRRAVDSCDLWADEYGVAFHAGKRVTDRIWEKKIAFLQAVLPTKAYMTVDTLPSASPSRNDMEWIVPAR